MMRISYLVLLIIALCLSLGILQSENSFAKDPEITPEELIAKHIKAIGDPKVLEGIRTRAIIGNCRMQILQGGFGQPGGLAQIASDGRMLGIVMRFDNHLYPGEHFAFDGKNVTIGRIIRRALSPLADFINQFDGVMKEGLLGGALSIGWCLGNLEETQPRLKYNEAKIAGRRMHELEYRPKRGLGDLKIVLFFEPETFYHIRTEYKLHIPPAFRNADIYCILSEDFSDFKEVYGMMLPHQYTISYSAEGGGRTFLTHYIFNAKQWVHNGQIDSRIFRAPE